MAPAPLPNFFIVGVPKAGTTSLYHYLAQHPQVYMSPVKEPSFFAVDELTGTYFPPDVREGVQRDGIRMRQYVAGSMDREAKGLALEWETYVQLFKHARHQIAIGEASVAYFWLPSAAARIRERVPHAKLIFVLRDPAERLFSQYLDGVRRFPGKTFAERFHGARAGTDVWYTTLDVDRYATNLERFFALFPREQIRIFLYDEFREDPHRFLREVFQFLGVQPDHPVDLSHRYHAEQIPRFAALEQIRRGPLGAVGALFGWMPDSMRRAVRGWLNVPRSARRISPDDRRMVIEYYAGEIERTQGLIGRDLTAWLR